MIKIDKYGVLLLMMDHIDLQAFDLHVFCVSNLNIWIIELDIDGGKSYTIFT